MQRHEGKECGNTRYNYGKDRQKSCRGRKFLPRQQRRSTSTIKGLFQAVPQVQTTFRHSGRHRASRRMGLFWRGSRFSLCPHRFLETLRKDIPHRSQPSGVARCRICKHSGYSLCHTTRRSSRGYGRLSSPSLEESRALQIRPSGPCPRTLPGSTTAFPAIPL